MAGQGECRTIESQRWRSLARPVFKSDRGALIPVVRIGCQPTETAASPSSGSLISSQQTRGHLRKRRRGTTRGGLETEVMRDGGREAFRRYGVMDDRRRDTRTAQQHRHEGVVAVRRAVHGSVLDGVGIQVPERRDDGQYVPRSLRVKRENQLPRNGYFNHSAGQYVCSRDRERESGHTHDFFRHHLLDHSQVQSKRGDLSCEVPR